DFTTQALQRAGGDHAFGGTADPQQQIDAGALDGRAERRGDVAVGDQPDAGAGFAHFPDDLRVPVAIQDHHGQIGDVALLGAGDGGQVVAYRSIDVDHTPRLRSHGDLVHIDDRTGAVHGASGGHGDDG